MRPGLKALVLALPLAVLAAAKLPAQPPPFPLDPYPIVELQDVSVVGADLTVTFNWSGQGAPPPPLAWLRLLDSQGQIVGKIGVAPVYGGQSVWIPGGASVRPGDSSTGPMSRYLSLIDDSSRVILFEKEVSVFYGGPATIFAPRKPLPHVWAQGRQCFLHVIDLTCDDPEDGGGDEPDLEIQTNRWSVSWSGEAKVPAGKTMLINAGNLLCDTCQNVNDSASIALWDLDDPGFPLFDPDDHLGTTFVGGCETVDPTTVTFQGSNYTYRLRYRITCGETLCP